jgi:hypothetical protein
MFQGVSGMVCSTNQTEIPFQINTNMEYYEAAMFVLLFVFLLVICVLHLIFSAKNANFNETQSEESCSGDIELGRRNTI